MISKNKVRIIVSIDKDNARKLSLIQEWYVNKFHPFPASKSEVINDAIDILSDKIGIF